MKIISLGWGVQSFTLAAMVALGKLEPVDYAVHADTSYESSLTYAFADKWTKWLEERGVKVVTLKQDNPIISKYGFVQIPAFTAFGQMKRQCTSNWKITPMRQWITTELKTLGISKSEGIVEQWTGISLDEFCRAKTNNVKYIKYIYPLLELGMTRNDCKKFLLDNGLDVPPKSSCIFCPFHGKSEWRQIFNVDADWKDALAIDNFLRNRDPLHTMYLHSTRIPLEDVDLRTPEEQGQMHLSESCSECWL